MTDCDKKIKRFGRKKDATMPLKYLSDRGSEYTKSVLNCNVVEDIEEEVSLYGETEEIERASGYTKDLSIDNVLENIEEEVSLYGETEEIERASGYTKDLSIDNVLENIEEEVSLYGETEEIEKASEYTKGLPIDNVLEDIEEEVSLYSESELIEKASEYTKFMPIDNVSEYMEEDESLYSEFEQMERASKYTEENIACSDMRHSYDAELDAEKKTAYKYALEIMDQESFCYLDDPDVLDNISRYNGRYWEILNEKQLKAVIYQYISMADKYTYNCIDSLCKNISKFIQYENTERYRSGERFTDSDFQKIQNRVVFRNLVYDVQTGEKLDFDKNLPYYFAVDAEYIEDDEDTPFYEKLKADATEEDEDSMNMFDYMIAYLIIPNRSGKCYFVLANAKDSGKSLLGQFISNVYVGNRTKSIDPEHLGGRFAFSNAGEMVLLSCLEMNTARLKKNTVAQIKRITGESRIRSEAKYQNEQTIMVRFKLMLATNGGILLPEGVEDNAFYRRTIVIPFIKSTPLDSLISDMDKKLQEEKNAILSNAVRKFKTYISEDGGIVFPESVLSLSMKEKWIGGKCVDDDFINQVLTYTGNPKDRIAIKELERVYHLYIEHQRLLLGDIIVSDRKTLTNKICSTYTGVEKKKSRVKNTVLIEIEGSTEALRRIMWNYDGLTFLQGY